MIHDLDKYVDLVGNINNRFDCEKFLICYLIHERDVKNIIKYMVAKGEITEKRMKELIEDGYIERVRDNETYLLDDFITTDKFNKDVFAPLSAGELFWNIYPSFLNSGKSSKIVDKDKFIYDYNKLVNRKPKLHNQIINSINNYIENSEFLYAEMSIDLFIKSEHWKVIEMKLNNTNNLK